MQIKLKPTFSLAIMNKSRKIKAIDIENCPASVLVTGMTHEGRGIATINHKKTFIAGALPNETVSVQLIKKNRSHLEAKVTEILVPAAERVEPPCNHFAICGGCSLQHMSMTAQLKLKEETLLNQLTHFGQVTPETILPPLHENSIGYRRKARLGVKFVTKKNKVLVGFREKSSHYLADLETCSVLYPDIGNHLIALQQLISNLSQKIAIPQIEVAVGDREAALVFRHLEPLPESDLHQLIAFGEKHHFHIYLQPNDKEKLCKIWPNNSLDRLNYTLPDFSLEFLFHPLDFTQINLELNRRMVKTAIDALALEHSDEVLDLFCGIGNFTLPIAKFAKHVTGVEGSDEMVRRAQENAKHNNINNTTFVNLNLEKPNESPLLQKSFDKILLDPPRLGAKEILSQISLFRTKRIVYVSCNPATLARDAGLLVNTHGFKLKTVGIMNMFPHTSHIEAMAVFEK